MKLTPSSRGRLKPATSEETRHVELSKRDAASPAGFSKPKLLVVNPQRPRLELIQPRLKPSIVEVMVGPNANAALLQRVRDGLAARGMGQVPVTQARSR